VTATVFLVTLLGAIALGMPIAFATILCAVTLMFAQGSFDTTLISQKLIEGADSYPLLAIPFFIFAGELMNKGGMSRRIIGFALAFVGHVRGGLGLVAVFAAVLMAAMTGSASADAAALGTLLVPMMREAGYNVPRSAGLIAAGSVIAPCLPPSVALIVFGVVANVSIGKLFMATIVPGLLLGVSLIVAWIWVVRKDRLEVFPRKSVREMFQASREAIWSLVMPFGIVGGMKFGIFTPTEASVAASTYALLVSAFVYRELKLRDIYPLLVSAAKTTAVIVFLIASALISAWLVTTSAVPQQVAAILEPFIGSPRILMLLMMVLVFFVGTALEFAPTVMILTPVLMPIVKLSGIDPVYFGVVFIVNNALCLIHPPVGIVLNVLRTVAKISMGDAIRGALPFLVAETIVLFLLVSFPQMVTVPYRLLTGG
jgi:tripartite ATP-independent transporter DctM subunit